RAFPQRITRRSRTALAVRFSTTSGSTWNVENSRWTTHGGTALIRRTKVVATLGPATGTPEGIAGLIGAGANVIRVNSSHGTPEERASWIAAVRAAAEAADVAVAVLVDLQGPRIRVGKLD